ncbi:TadE/TadG family type IV pilus assembly protein [Pseudoduganella sp. HUAS MS19]
MKRLRCRGVAAIEAALVMAVLAPLLVLALNIGRLAINGAAVDRAASNAARFLSTVPLEILRDASRRGVVLDSARSLVDQTLAAAAVDVQTLNVEFLCDPGNCSTLPANYTPTKIGVLVSVDNQAIVDLGTEPVLLSVYAEVGRDD